MKIIYEEGDIVELDDDMNVPHELGASTVKLIHKLSPSMFVNGENNWTVEVIEGWGVPSGGKYQLNEKWFNPI